MRYAGAGAGGWWLVAGAGGGWWLVVGGGRCRCGRGRGRGGGSDGSSDNRGAVDIVMR